MNACRPIAPAELLELTRDYFAGVAHNPHARGYVVTYDGPETRCPCCGRSNWLVGRQLAECAFCTTPVPLPEAGMTSSPTPIGVAHRTPPAIVRGGHRRAA